MTRDDGGFTLTETLMALVVIGLSLGGIMQVTAQVGKVNARAVAMETEHKLQTAAHRSMQAKLQASEPLSDTLQGEGRSMSFTCDDGECSFTAKKDEAFRYVSEGQVHTVWPIIHPEDGRDARLEAILIVDKSGNIRDVIKFMVEHDADCQFDMISRVCRKIEASDPSAGNEGQGA